MASTGMASENSFAGREVTGVQAAVCDPF